MMQLIHVAALAVVVAYSVYKVYIFHQQKNMEKWLQQKEKRRTKHSIDVNLARVKLKCSAVEFDVTGLKKMERKLRLQTLQVNHYNGLVQATCKAALNTGGPTFLLEIVRIAHEHDQRIKENYFL